MTKATPLLEVKGLSKHFEGLVALDCVDMDVPDGVVMGLIGPNGSGKTTLFNVITGIFPPTGGQIFFKGSEITSLPSYTICRLGIARTFQQLRLFRDMTVKENVLAGLIYAHSGKPKAGLSVNRRKNETRAQELLEQVGLSGKDKLQAGSLPYGEQRLLEVARALATEPQLLLLDEPVAGMNPAEIKNFMELVGQISKSGTSILLIEHNMRVVMDNCDPIYVFDQGHKIAQGKGCDLQCNQIVIKAYLGEDIDDVAS